MCDRHGDYRVPDFSRFKTSRRRFLGGTAAALTLAAGPALSAGPQRPPVSGRRTGPAFAI